MQKMIKLFVRMLSKIKLTSLFDLKNFIYNSINSLKSVKK